MTKSYDEVTVQMMDEAEKLNWEWVASRPVSSHPDDWYLAYCVVINHKNEAVSYIYNAEFNSFNLGHYFNNTSDALNHFEQR